jgi:HEAT repeat protein
MRRAVALLLAGIVLLSHPSPAAPNGFPHFAISREQLIELLKSPDPQHRLGAATSLGIRREQAAVEPLLEVVERQDEAEAVKVEAVEALGAIRDRRAVSRLAARLDREPSARVRAQIAEALGDLGGELSQVTLRSLVANDRSPEVRGRAAVALGRLKAPGSRSLLEERLAQEENPEVRAALLQGLGLLGDAGAAPAVLTLFMQEQDPSLRIAAALALGSLGDLRATPKLMAVLTDRSGDLSVRQAVALALGQLRDPAAIPPLGALLDESDIVVVVLGVRALGETGRPEAAAPLVKLGRELAREADAQRPSARLVERLTVRIEVIRALGRLGDSRAWPLIERSLAVKLPGATSAEALRIRERLYELRRAAVLALSGMRDQQKALGWLSRLLGDRDPRIRAEAARALGLRGEQEGVAVLRKALRDKDPEVRWEAARAFGRVPARESAPALRQLLADPHPRVVAEAARALGVLGVRETLPELEALLRFRQEDEVQEALAEALSLLNR